MENTEYVNRRLYALEEDAVRKSRDWSATNFLAHSAERKRAIDDGL
jgi:hypothetical protein